MNTPRIAIGHQHQHTKFIIQLRLYQHLNVCESGEKASDADAACTNAKCISESPSDISVVARSLDSRKKLLFVFAVLFFSSVFYLRLRLCLFTSQGPDLSCNSVRITTTMTIKRRREMKKKVVKSIFNSLKEESVGEGGKNSFGGIMLSVNIFFMLFEKLLYVTKELLLLMLLIFVFFHSASLSLSTASPPPPISSFAKNNLFNGSSCRGCFCEICWGMAKHNIVLNWSWFRAFAEIVLRSFLFVT